MNNKNFGILVQIDLGLNLCKFCFLQRSTRISASDRFIPRRDNIDLEFAYHLMERDISSNEIELDGDFNEFKVSEIGVINIGKYMYFRDNYNIM